MKCFFIEPILDSMKSGEVSAHICPFPPARSAPEPPLCLEEALLSRVSLQGVQMPVKRLLTFATVSVMGLACAGQDSQPGTGGGGNPGGAGTLGSAGATGGGGSKRLGGCHRCHRHRGHHRHRRGRYHRHGGHGRDNRHRWHLGWRGRFGHGRSHRRWRFRSSGCFFWIWGTGWRSRWIRRRRRIHRWWRQRRRDRNRRNDGNDHRR